MPLAVSPVPVGNRFDRARAVLFVACNVCPRMHLAWTNREPLFRWTSVFGRADSFTKHVKTLQLEAVRSGKRSAVFRTPSTTPMCLWSRDLAKRFTREADGYDAIGVIGCESAVRTVAQACPGKQLEQLVRVEGIANFTLQKRLPLEVRILAASRVPLPAPNVERSD